MKTFHTRAIRILGILLILWGGLVLLLPLFLPPLMVSAPNGWSEIDTTQDPGPEELARLGVDLHLRVHVGPPDVSLSSFVINPDRPEPRGTILLLHGHRDNKLSQLEFGRWVAGGGYRVVLVDHRGHGLSTGEYVSFGVHESRDMVTLLDTLQAQGLLRKPLGVIGFSFGAAVAVQLGAKDDRVAGIVSLSTFSSMREVIEDYVECFLPFVAPMISEREFDEAVAEGGEVAGFEPAEADTRGAARQLRIPLLVIHGEEDWKIPVEHGERLHAAARRSEMVRVPGRGHDNLLKGEEGRALLENAFSWLDRTLAQTGDKGVEISPANTRSNRSDGMTVRSDR